MRAEGWLKEWFFWSFRLFAREPITIERDDHGPKLVLVVAMLLGRVQPQERDRGREVELGLIDA